VPRENGIHNPNEDDGGQNDQTSLACQQSLSKMFGGTVMVMVWVGLFCDALAFRFHAQRVVDRGQKRHQARTPWGAGPDVSVLALELRMTS
jgi:hypothetical protein